MALPPAAFGGIQPFQLNPHAKRGPEILPSGRILFKLHSSKAQKVDLMINAFVIASPPFKKAVPLNQNEEGNWTVEIEPLPPQIYSYTFVVDGIEILDPTNPNTVPNFLYLGSALTVPGPSPMPWESQAIDHGTLHRHTYASKILGTLNDFYVYTPPHFDPSSSAKYPVLYLLHGFSDDASAWSTVGQAPNILDHLIAAKEISPLIVVMPLGYGTQLEPRRNQTENQAKKTNSKFSAKGDPEWERFQEKNRRNFPPIFRNEILAQAEALYPISKRPDERGIAGLSMGGGQSFQIASAGPGDFGHVASFSGNLNVEDLAIGNLAPIKQLYITCGTEDFLFQTNQRFIERAKTLHLNPTTVIRPGGHTWMFWRESLIGFLKTAYLLH